MSHAATNWAIQQRGLKPATKIVLWFLCDRHNPDFGCFPTQARLADDVEMSISALNQHLAQLQEMRLIHRVRTHHPHTHKREATRYILGFEDGFPPEPTPETGDGNPGTTTGTDIEQTSEPTPDSGHGAISGFCAKPSPDFGQSHLRNPETNLVREPVKEECARGRDDAFDLFFSELILALGFVADTALPVWWQGWPAEVHVRHWIDDLGLTEDQIIDVARRSRQDHPAPPDGPKALDRAMHRAARHQPQVRSAPNGAAESTGGRRGGKVAHGRPPPSEDQKAAFYAALVNSERFLPASAISAAMRDAMLVRGMVTPERLHQRGIR